MLEMEEEKEGLVVGEEKEVMEMVEKVEGQRQENFLLVEKLTCKA